MFNKKKTILLKSLCFMVPTVSAVFLSSFFAYNGANITSSNTTASLSATSSVTSTYHYSATFTPKLFCGSSSAFSLVDSQLDNASWMADIGSTSAASHSKQGLKINLSQVVISCDIDNIAFDETPAPVANSSTTSNTGAGSRSTSLSDLVDAGLIRNLNFKIPTGGLQYATYKGQSVWTSFFNFGEISITYSPQGYDDTEKSQHRTYQNIINPIYGLGDLLKPAPEPYSYSLSTSNCAGNAVYTYVAMDAQNIFSSIPAHILSSTDSSGHTTKQLVVDSNCDSLTNKMNLNFMIMRPGGESLSSYYSATISAHTDTRSIHLVQASASSPTVFAMNSADSAGNKFFDIQKAIAVDNSYTYVDVDSLVSNDRARIMLRINKEYFASNLLAWDTALNQTTGYNGSNWLQNQQLSQLWASICNDETKIKLINDAIIQGKLLNFETSSVLNSSTTDTRFKIPFFTYTSSNPCVSTKSESYKYFFDDYEYGSSYSVLVFLRNHIHDSNADLQSAINSLPTLQWHIDASKFKVPLDSEYSGTNSKWQYVTWNLADSYIFMLTAFDSGHTGGLTLPYGSEYFRYRYNPAFFGEYGCTVCGATMDSVSFPNSSVTLSQLIGSIDAEYNDIVNSSEYQATYTTNYPNVAQLGLSKTLVSYTSNTPVNITFYSGNGTTSGYSFLTIGSTNLPFMSAYYSNNSTPGIWNYAASLTTDSFWSETSDGTTSSYTFSVHPLSASNIINPAYKTSNNGFASNSTIYEWSQPQSPKVLTATQYTTMVNFFHSLSPKKFIEIWNANYYNIDNKRFYTIFINATTSFKIKIDWSLFINVLPFFENTKKYSITSPYIDDSSITVIADANPCHGTSFSTPTDWEKQTSLTTEVNLYLSGTSAEKTTSLDFTFTNMGTDLDNAISIAPLAKFQVYPTKLKNITFFIENVMLFKGEDQAQHNLASIYFPSLTRSEYNQICLPEWFNISVKEATETTPALVMYTVTYPACSNANVTPQPYYANNGNLLKTVTGTITNFPPVSASTPTPYVPVGNTGLSAGAIAGISIASFAVFVIAVDLVARHIKKRKMMREDELDEEKLKDAAGQKKKEVEDDLGLA